MTAKEYLLQYQRLTEDLRALQERIIQARTIAESTTTQLTGMPRGTTVGDKVGNSGAKLADMEREEEIRKATILDKQKEICAMIDRIPDVRHVKLLRIRYIELDPHGRLQTWEAVADQIGYALEWTKGGLHSQALESFNKILKDTIQ